MIIREPFSILFPKKPEVVDAIRLHMDEHGFDPAYPIIVGTGPWTDEPVLIDGHTRLMIANELGVSYVPEIEKRFETEILALEYAIHVQRDRRNITDAHLASALGVYDNLKQRGGLRDMATDTLTGRFTAKASREAIAAESHAEDFSTPPVDFISDAINDVLSTESITRDNDKGKSAEIVGKLFGVSRAKVERARAVMAEDTPTEIKEAVLSGEKTINKAYNEVREIKKQTEDIKKEVVGDSKSVFNESNDNIEWSIWTWNPVTGCKHGCDYCYAEGIANRFYAQKFEPTFYENRLSAPLNSKIPEKYNNHPGKQNVFVCSMADLFGDWVDESWINRVLEVCEKTPQWNYLFLTKNPKRLLDYSFPKNSWVGTTVDIKARLKHALEIMPQVDAPIKFISFEPLLEDMGEPNLSFIDWIIIGGQSGDTSRGIPPKQPKWKWVESLLMAARKADVKVYFKPNLLVRPKEYPEIEEASDDNM